MVLVDEAAVHALGKLGSPQSVNRITGCGPGLAKRMYPFCQVVIILAVALPFEMFVKRFVWFSFAQLLAYPQAANGWVSFARNSFQATDPALARVVAAMLAKGLMHLVDKVCGQPEIFLFTCLPA
ncbi:MAG: hypothetical protein OER56_00185 [Hyphomicrobiales bacterium]|nr:hypothetical protein [Hyphomicrobiales bacterium]